MLPVASPIVQATHQDIERAIHALEAGHLVGLPTETVYGLAADARNPDAIAKIYAAKQRPNTHPLIVHVAHHADLTQWIMPLPPHVHAIVHRLMTAFWPGALTLILPKHSSVLTCVTGGQSTIALRCPAHPIAQAVLAAFHKGQGGLAAPSANRFGRISPTTAQHVYDELGDQVDMILDGGSCTVGIESTILDLTPCLSDQAPRILRLGAITAQQLSHVMGIMPVYEAQHHQLASSVGLPGSVRVSGTLAAHYAPSKPLHWLDVSHLTQLLATSHHVGLWLTPDDQIHVEHALKDFFKHNLEYANHLIPFIMPTDPTVLAQCVYNTLRQMDQSPADVLMLSRLPASTTHSDLWQAIADRLGRAIVGSNEYHVAMLSRQVT
jgi:L-threonylcarbamoyladenylate synthase